MRWTSDPPRVEGTLLVERGAAGGEAELGVELEDVGALEEEGPLLGEKGLEGGEVHLRGICFDLAEVRMDRESDKC